MGSRICQEKHGTRDKCKRFNVQTLYENNLGRADNTMHSPASLQPQKSFPASTQYQTLGREGIGAMPLPPVHSCDLRMDWRCDKMLPKFNACIASVCISATLGRASCASCSRSSRQALAFSLQAARNFPSAHTLCCFFSITACPEGKHVRKRREVRPACNQRRRVVFTSDDRNKARKYVRLSPFRSTQLAPALSKTCLLGEALSHVWF